MIDPKELDTEIEFLQVSGQQNVQIHDNLVD